jgi:hypothetical protein
VRFLCRSLGVIEAAGPPAAAAAWILGGCIRAAAASPDGATAGAGLARGAASRHSPESGVARLLPRMAAARGPAGDDGPGPGSRLAPPARGDHDAGPPGALATEGSDLKAESTVTRTGGHAAGCQCPRCQLPY